MTQQQLVFLGGTCGKNTWRNVVISALVAQGVSKDALFNPVVENWTKECQVLEDQVKATAPIVVYYLASPKDDNPNSVSAYSLVEATMALYDDSDRAVVVFDTDGLSGHVLKVMKKVEDDLKKRFPTAAILSSVDLIPYLAKRVADLG
ncbi:MAG: nucleoside 2-deoxyribosyltransferase domain-containing protein [Bdellovibrionota bacterium]